MAAYLRTGDYQDQLLRHMGRISPGSVISGVVRFKGILSIR